MKLSELDGHREELEEEFLDFIVPTGYVPHVPQLDELIDAASRSSDGTVSGFVKEASDLIHEKFKYVKGATHVNSSIKDSLAVGAGVCQDFAHLLLGVVRKQGLPARYVSGYLVPESAASPDAKLQEVIGGSASHAWAEVYLPDTGWIGLDPTLGKPLGLQHVRIAYGRDYGDVAPVRGVYKGHAGQRLSVDVSVRPEIDDDGREQLNENKAGTPGAARNRGTGAATCPTATIDCRIRSNSLRVTQVPRRGFRVLHYPFLLGLHSGTLCEACRPAPLWLWFVLTIAIMRFSSRSRDASITSDWRSPRATRLT